MVNKPAEGVEVSFLIPVLYLGSFVLAAFAVKRTQRPDERSTGTPARLGRALAGVGGYPAAVALIWSLWAGDDLTVGTVVLLALAGLVFGWVVGRPWILAVPPVTAGAWLMIKNLAGPSCAGDCEYDAWAVIALTMFIVVLPAVFSLMLGLLARNLLGPRAAKYRRPSATAWTNRR